ncbi:GerAB/ArcD/ProY family transporter [Jeotgalibacillus soli]|uniref:Spore germination protein KB n=1 Tax=Jeotgalibacillus soli TaxID=889306 RepID=A0A0C2VW66_9BACL|nr:GerAB/ArcD/ProY family transporter [Jeotgalibacillus soli]KIL48223.1 spore germination protein KB [Jeotgalibacillus soli]
MEQAKISAYQLFVLIVMFTVGSALMLPLASEVKQSAWLAILLGMGGGFLLYLIYHGLYQYYPNILPTEYVQKLLGKTFGRVLGFIYILYFMYLAARVLRDFGEMLLTFAYEDTPLFIANALLIIVIVYTVRKGIEVIARTGELLFVLAGLLAISGLILIIASGVIDTANLKPVLEKGLGALLKTTATQTLYVPFGEVVVFAMILPYLNKSEKAKRAGLLALTLSGVTLALVAAINISVLGVSLLSRSQFPLLSSIQMIQIAGFLERLDVYFMLTLIIGGFCKIGIYTYVAIIGTADLFNIKESSQLSFPIGLIILLLSIIIASNFSEHIQEGLQIVTLYILFPMQVIIPVLLLVIAFFKNRKKNNN